jgi:DNA-binding NtrC family response regulator
MSGRTTTETTGSQPRSRDDGGDDPPALVILWSSEKPPRAGEVALLPPSSAPYLLGRGGADEAEAEERVRFVQQRPGESRAAPPLAGSKLSRRQALVRSADGRALEVTRIGRCPMLLRGREVEACKLVPGDVLCFRRELLLLCAQRPRRLPAATSYRERDFPFGEADGAGLVGESPAAWELREQLGFAALRELHVLVLGESGTGKELAAQAIHALSSRRSRPLVARSAATLPPGILDAELFGNLRDYPNPGMRERKGLVGEADGGSLFLDEIGELPEDMQSHLLRVLDAGGQYHRLGEDRARTSDLRLIGATNRSADRLKHDLLARLTLRISLPGLDERPEDVPLLARHLLRLDARRDRDLAARFFDGAEPRLSPELIEALVRHRFTHHARELKALLWQAISRSRGDVVELTPEVEEALSRTGAPPPPPPAELTREILEASIERHHGVLERVWRELGLANRFALGRLLKKHGIPPRRSPDQD